MTEVRGLRLTTSAALKEQRLAALLREGRPEAAAHAAVEDAQVAGSLELAGLPLAAEETGRLRSALRAVDPEAPLSVAALMAWHRAATGDGGYRRSERTRATGPAAA